VSAALAVTEALVTVTRMAARNANSTGTRIRALLIITRPY